MLVRASKFESVVLAVVSVCACGAVASAQVRPNVPTGRVSAATPALDNTSLLGKHLLGSRAVQRGSLASMARKTVEVAPGKQAQLGNIAAAAFASQQALKAELGRASSGLFGAVVQRDEAIELPDRFIITRTTSAVVKTPATVRGVSQAFREQTSGQSGTITLASLPADARAGLRAFMQEAQGYAPGHPMRAAAARGEQGMLDAIAAGEGTFEVTDTIVVPKRAVVVRQGTVSAPTQARGVQQYSTTRPVNLGLSTTASAPSGVLVGGQTSAALHRGTRVDSPGVRGGGTYQSTARRLNGFTFADAWEWERTWRYPSGFFRFGVSAWYGLGLRIPIEVKATVSPTQLQTRQAVDPALSYDVRLSTAPVNGNAAYYQQAGLSPEQVLQGRELAAGGGFTYNLKLRALWTTVITRSGGREFRLTGGTAGSGDFTPPIGNATRSASIFVPASLTGTSLSFGPLSGKIELGVKVNMKGRITGDVTGLVDGRAAACDDRGTSAADLRTPHRFDHRSATQESVYNCPLPRSNTSKNTSYGFRVSNLNYRADWSLTPGAQGSVSARYKGWGKTFKLTFWLDSVSIPLGSSSFGAHAGTANTVQWQGGLKRFERP